VHECKPLLYVTMQRNFVVVVLRMVYSGVVQVGGVTRIEGGGNARWGGVHAH